MTPTGNPNRFLALQWLRAVTDAAGLDDTADRPGISAIVTVAVCRTFYADNDGTRCFPSQRTLAETGGMCHKTVSAVDDWLLETGFMAFVMRRKDGQNSYRLNFPSGESDGNEKRFPDSDRGRTPAVPRPERGRTPAGDSETGADEKRFSDDDRGRTPADRGRSAGVRPTTFPVSSVSGDDDDGSGTSLRSAPQPQSTSIPLARFEFVLQALDDALNDIFPDIDDIDDGDEGDALWATCEAAYDRCARPFVQFCQTYPSDVPGEYAGTEQILACVAALDTQRQRQHLDHLVRVDRQCRQRLTEFTTTQPAKKETNT